MTGHRFVRAGILIAFVVALGAASASAQSAERPSGHWEGAIQAPGQEIAFAIDLIAGSGGKWQGAISIPSQNVKGFPIAEITARDKAVGFAMKGVPGDPRFAGTLSEDGKTIAGDLSQGGATLPFTLAWKGEAKFDPTARSTAITKEVEGTWEGALSVNGTTLRLVLRLASSDGAAAGTVVSVDQGGSEIPITTITQTASHLVLDVSVVSAKYEGDLKDGQLTGTWSQGGGSLPLAFKRSAP